VDCLVAEGKVFAQLPRLYNAVFHGFNPCLCSWSTSYT
jgi:hypothetical protein